MSGLFGNGEKGKKGGGGLFAAPPPEGAGAEDDSSEESSSEESSRTSSGTNAPSCHTACLLRFPPRSSAMYDLIASGLACCTGCRGADGWDWGAAEVRGAATCDHEARIRGQLQAG